MNRGLMGYRVGWVIGIPYRFTVGLIRGFRSVRVKTSNDHDDLDEQVEKIRAAEFEGKGARP